VTLRLDAAACRPFLEALFQRAGASGVNAAILAEHLVTANLVGHDSHGLERVADYLRSVQGGRIRPAVEPEVIRDDGPLAVVSGRWTFGQVTALAATRQAIARAKRHRLALVGCVQTHHVGRLGHYMELAAGEGVIACMMVGGDRKSVV
jgi:uncharacterized oxidoreductase